MTYCFDSSGWIQAWNDLPQGTFPGLWDRIHGLVEESRIISPDEVLREVARKDDAVHAWVKARSKLFVRLDGSFLARGKEITNKYPRMLDQKPGKNGADPFVVALALDRGAIVVTEEAARNNLTSPGIPDVCKAEKVHCLSVLEFIQRERWVFR